MLDGENYNGDAVHGGGCGGGEGGTQCLTAFVEKGTAESIRYFLSRKTILEMLRDRGYGVADSEVNRSLAEFRAQFGNNPSLESLRICASLVSNPPKKILVIFLGTDEVKTATIRSVYGQLLGNTNLSGLIMVLQSKMNQFARKELEKFPFKVEVFQIRDLLVNITKHVLQPKLQILTTEEKKQLLKAYNLEDKQLPGVLETDALARYYGLKKGQVVKVSFDGEFVGSLTTYRCVM